MKRTRNERVIYLDADTAKRIAAHGVHPTIGRWNRDWISILIHQLSVLVPIAFGNAFAFGLTGAIIALGIGAVAIVLHHGALRFAL